MNKQSTLQEIEIASIHVGGTNPRKTFDEQSLKELALSIQSKGVLQPILVRPIENGMTGPIQKEFELVCGERRYKASIMAGLGYIPANIRELSDDEAFEMQIIENLERKDVHPLEEADAFKRMLDSGKYQIADIAAKFAKPETFIAQRLKFVDLIDEIKKDFYEGKLGIGHAIHIARLGQKDQKDIYESSLNGWNPGYGTVNELRDQIENDTYDLDEAPFDTRDENLLKCATACEVCPKRAGANPTLFADIEETNRCFDTGCYDQKMEAHITKTIARIIENGEDVLFGRGYNAPEGFIKDLIGQYKLTVLRQYDDFRETSGELGKITGQKLFYVSGSSAGKMVNVNLYDRKGGNAMAGEPTVQDQIKKIEERAKRALELDNVKVFQAIKEDKRLYDEYPLSDEPLTELESKALWYLFKKEVPDYSSVREYNKLVNSPDSYNDTKEFEFYKNANFEDLKINRLVRMAIKDKLTSMHEPNFEKCTKSRFYFEIISAQMSQSVKAIVDAQTAIAEKRIARTNAKLKELRGEGDRQDSLETRLEKFVELGFEIDDRVKEIKRGGIAMKLEDIEKMSPEEFKKSFEFIEQRINKKPAAKKAKAK